MRNEESPRSSHQPFVEFARPKPNEPLTIRPLVRRVVVSRMHRIAKRSIPCLTAPCPFCESQYPLDNRVYMIGQPQGRASVVFVDLPSSHFAQLDDLADTTESLSTYMLKIGRLGPNQNSPIGIRPVGRFTDMIECFTQSWVESVLDRNFASNLSKALVLLVGDEKRSTTIARGETSLPHPYQMSPEENEREASNFIAALERSKRN